MSSTNHSLNRRELLRNGGLVLSLGAIVAACGSERTGSDAPGRIGNEVLPETTDPDLTVDDAVLLRTLQSLEHSTIEMHNRLAASGALSAGAAELAERFIADHGRHAEAIGALVTQAGGTPYDCANPFVMERAVEVLAATLTDSDDAARDALNIAVSFENIMAASYQAIAARLADPALRAAAMKVGGEEHRHAAVLSLAIDDTMVAPELTEPMEPSPFPRSFAVPAAFGQLTGIPVASGKPNEENARVTVQLQTPAENTFVYHDLAC